MASKEFENWLKNQKHKPGDKITNIQRLTSKFLPPAGVTTWGQWYESAGITPGVEKSGKSGTQTTPKTETTKYLKPKITMTKVSIENLKTELYRLEPGTQEYEDTVTLLNQRKKELKDYQSRYDAAYAKEQAPKIKKENEETAKDYDSKLDAWKKKVAEAEKDVQAAKDSGGDVQAAQDEVNRIKGDKPQKPAEKPVPGEKYKGTPAPTSGPIPGFKPDVKYGTPATGDKATVTNQKPVTPKGKVTSGKDKTPTIPQLTDEEQRIAALDVAATDFSLPETIFKNVPSLNRILQQYVDENWTESKLRKAIRDDNWYRKNSAEIKARYVQKFNYDDLVATGQATGSTDYEMQISKIERALAKRAAEIGSAAANDPAALRKAAENLYITNRSEDTTYIDDFLAASIKPISGMIGGKVTEGYSGEALKNYNTLVEAARDNGFQVSDIIPGGANEQQVLQGIASGKIDINRVVADARKLAAQGQPQYVRDLLSQGYTLKQIFQPYRQTMAATLEIGDPDQIDLNDPLLRSAITDKGDMNVYDFKKALRQDNRWQYTEQAKKDVSNAALQVLRDFGFQG